MKSKLFGAVAILIGTIVGGGIFGIPFVVSRIGFIPGVIYLLVLGVIIFITTLCYGEVVLRTKKTQQITGYAETYLGKWGKRVISFSLIFGIYGALLAYMLAVGDFLNALLKPHIGGTPFLYTVIFFILASLVVLAGMKMVVKIEKGMVFVLIVIIAIIFIFGFSHVKVDNLTYFDMTYFFLPYGVILFAFSGASVVANMKRTLLGQEDKLKRSIFLGYMVVFIIYLVFSIIVCGITGIETSEEAIIGLNNVLGENIFFIGALLGILTMTTSFLTLGLILKETYVLDYDIDKTTAWVYACFVPFIIFLLGFTDFIKVIGMVGAITGGLQGIIIILMFLKAKKTGDKESAYSINLPKFFAYLLYLIFSLGILYEIIILFF